MGRTFYDLKIHLRQFQHYKLDVYKERLYLLCFNHTGDFSTINEESFIDAISYGKKLYKILKEYAPPFEIGVDESNKGKTPYLINPNRYIITLDDSDNEFQSGTFILNNLLHNTDSILNTSDLLSVLKCWIYKYGVPWNDDDLHNFEVYDDIHLAFKDANILIYKFIDLLIFMYIVYESVISNNFSKLFDTKDTIDNRRLLLKIIYSIEYIAYNKESPALINNKMVTKLDNSNENDIILKLVFDNVYDFLWFKLKSFVATYFNNENIDNFYSHMNPYKLCKTCNEPFISYSNNHKYCPNCGDTDSERSKRSYNRKKELRNELSTLFLKSKEQIITKSIKHRIDTIINFSASKLKKDIKIKELEELINKLKG